VERVARDGWVRATLCRVAAEPTEPTGAADGAATAGDAVTVGEPETSYPTVARTTARASGAT
jgi:hypothetical protein